MTQGNRFWAIGSVTLMIVLVLAGWFIGAQPLLSAAATADATRIQVESQNAANQAIINQLALDNENLPALAAEYQELQQSIPGSAGTSAFIDGLDSLANNAGVTVTGFTVGNPKPYTVPASAATVPTPTTTTAPSAGATAAPVVPVAPVGSVAVTSPLITPDNFVGIDISVDVHGPYVAVLDFIKGLQGDGRLFLVTGIVSAKDADSGDDNVVSAKVSGLIYVIKPAG